MIFKMSYLLTALDKLNNAKIDLRENTTHYKVYYSYPHDIKSIGINPDDLISFAGGWVNHKSPKELQNILKDKAGSEDI